VRGITPAHQNPFKMWLLDSEDKPIRPLIMPPGIDEPYNALRQMLPRAYAHNGLIDIIRTDTILKMNSMSGRTILPVLFDPGYDIDLDTPDDWMRAEERLMVARLLLVWPGEHRRVLPNKIKLLVLDFDGVLTDNRVWVDQDGREMVAANRSDSLGIDLLRQVGVETVVISRETNPVVAARCRKMNVTCIQGENDKETALRKLVADRGIDPAYVVYCGNDANDLPCFPLVGWAVAVADSVPEVLRKADFVLSKQGGHGAVRELCGLILSANEY
jgi:N-acylneuraminate cytidylyltransferase